MIFASKKMGVLFLCSLLMAQFLVPQFLGAMEDKGTNLNSVILNLKQKLEQVRTKLGENGEGKNFLELSLNEFLNNQENSETEALAIKCDKSTTIYSVVDFKNAFKKFEKLKDLRLRFDWVNEKNMNNIVSGLCSKINWNYIFYLPKNLKSLTLNFNNSNVNDWRNLDNLENLFSKVSTLKLLETFEIKLENINENNMNNIVSGLCNNYGTSNHTLHLPTNLKNLTLDFNNSNAENNTYSNYTNNLGSLFSKLSTLNLLKILKIKLENINENNMAFIASGLEYAYKDNQTDRPTKFNIEVISKHQKTFTNLGATVTIIQEQK
jgi:hypothetical protein